MFKAIKNKLWLINIGNYNEKSVLTGRFEGGSERSFILTEKRKYIEQGEMNYEYDIQERMYIHTYIADSENGTLLETMKGWFS